MEPLAGPEHQAEMLDELGLAVREGATVAAGGGRPAEARLGRGCFVEPSILTGVEPGMSIWRNEVFCPVLVVREVDGFDEAVEATNGSRFGLPAALFTKSLRQAHCIADVADVAGVGRAAVSPPTSGWDVQLPVGGFGNSGSAFKEQGLDALRFSTRTTTVAVAYGV